MEKTNKNVFITGQAGTGKSTLLKEFRKNTKKNVVVLAPTGIAALNVEGQTIHSFFRFPNSVVTEDKIKITREKSDLFKSIDTIIIDEISMVRVDMIDGIDYALRQYRKNDIPFGGVQIILFGDLFQLPPILSDNADNEFITSNYKSQYFFDADVFKKHENTVYELTKVYRQADSDFVELLNCIRINTATEADLNKLNTNFSIPITDDEYIYLTARRKTADDINNEKLNLIEGKKIVKKCDMVGSFVDSVENIDFKYPAPETLEFKISSKIMMLNNDISKRWVNGTRGTVVKCDDDGITVLLEGKEYQVTKHTWKRMKYTYNPLTRKVEEKQIGTFTQYPLQLANAITIHKSQGMTFDKVIVDIGMGAFAHGQVYVALSRCRTLNNLIIKTTIKQSDIMIDPLIVDFYNSLLSLKVPSVVSNIELRKEFVRELNKYLDIQLQAGYFGAKKVTRTFESAMFLARFQGPKSIEILWKLKEKNTIEYSIEALCIKKKYKDLVLDVRETAIKKLLAASVNFDDFQQENRP
jgi:ATP-dependent exoDNAse (exonuclease V) alpha subunit